MENVGVAMSVKSSVNVILPPQLSGGQVADLFTRMGLRADPSSAEDEWIVRDVARGPRSTDQLVWSDVLAKPGMSEDRFDEVNAIPQDQYMTGLDPARIDAEWERIGQYRTVPSLAPTFYATQVAMMSASDAQVGDAARKSHHNLAAMRLVDSEELVFPELSAYWIRLHPILYTRASFPALCLRLMHDSALVEDIRRGEVARASSTRFAANMELVAPGLLHGNYFGPLIACASPGVWAVHCPRMLNSMILSLGRVVPGLSQIPMDALQLLPGKPRSKTLVEVKPESPVAWGEAIDWWAMRLNQLFDFLSNPVTFDDGVGNYEPYRHQNWLINTTQLFDRVTSSLRAASDEHAALLLTFSALDLVSEQFFGNDTGAVSDPAYAREALEDVRAGMPSRVAQVLLPAAERAVSALDNVSDGFFHQTGFVEYIYKEKAQKVTVEAAVSPLMRARRNAVHGFGGKKAEAKGAHELLAQHNGNLPADLVYLPYLYLLKVLCDLDGLLRKIKRGND
ncbi:hypothetical protein QMA15_30750 [Rhodococcus sp. APC 3903]|nr:hypothetical protein [Rhodococcus sp. APC 3903]